MLLKYENNKILWFYLIVLHPKSMDSCYNSWLVKHDHFNNIDIKSVSDSKKFWKTIRPYFSNKGLNSKKIFLSEKRRLIKDPVPIATTMNDYFLNIMQTVGLGQFQFDLANNLFKDHRKIIKFKKSNLICFIYLI